MAWQDIRGHYDDRGEEADPAPVELAECECWVCGRKFSLPADDPDRFCSQECGNEYAAEAHRATDEAYRKLAEQADNDEVPPW